MAGGPRDQQDSSAAHGHAAHRPERGSEQVLEDRDLSRSDQFQQAVSELVGLLGKLSDTLVGFLLLFRMDKDFVL